MAAALERTSSFTSVSIGSIPPWVALLVVLLGLFGLPTLVKWVQEGTWRNGPYVDPYRSAWLDLLLALSVTGAVFAARDTDASGVWYTTVWWHLACLLAIVAVVCVRWRIHPGQIRHVLTTVGEPRHPRNLFYVLIAGWMVALIPALLFSGPAWARPINLGVLIALFALSVFGRRLIRWADHMDEHVDSLEGRIQDRRAGLSH